MPDFEKSFAIKFDGSEFQSKEENARALQKGKKDTIRHILSNHWKKIDFKMASLDSFRMEDGRPVPNGLKMSDGPTNGVEVRKPQKGLNNVAAFFDDPANQGKKLLLRCPDGEVHFFGMNEEKTQFVISEEPVKIVPKPEKPSWWDRFKSIFTKVESVERWNREKAEWASVENRDFHERMNEFVKPAREAVQQYNASVLEEQKQQEAARKEEENLQKMKLDKQRKAEEKLRQDRRRQEEQEEKDRKNREREEQKQKEIRERERQKAAKPELKTEEKKKEVKKTVDAPKPAAKPKEKDFWDAKSESLKADFASYKVKFQENPLMQACISEDFVRTTRSNSLKIFQDTFSNGPSHFTDSYKDPNFRQHVAEQLVLTMIEQNLEHWENAPQKLPAKQMAKSLANSREFNEQMENMKELDVAEQKELTKDLFATGGQKFLENEELKELVGRTIGLDKVAVKKVETTEVKKTGNEDVKKPEVVNNKQNQKGGLHN